MPFPDPRKPEPRWKVRAQAIEYWTVGALVVGAWVYGLSIGLRDLARLVGL